MKKMMHFGFQFNEPNENYEEDLSKEAKDIINTLNPWKLMNGLLFYLIVHGTLVLLQKYYLFITSSVATEVRA